MRTTFVGLTALTLCAAPAEAGHLTAEKAIFPQGWGLPLGWHVDRAVKRAIAEGDITGTGLPVRAVLLTNDVSLRLIVFVNYKSPTFKAYNVFEEPAANLKSDDGINIDYDKEIQVEYVPDRCGSRWVRCDKRGQFFDPPMPTLWFAMGDWGGLVFRWKNAPSGFDWLSSGD